ncbi:Trace amine-associated receptor 7e [Trichoplax sp. H2]|uniref:G-protein coupled receptors family 1 profile domain-containing protein n=1 Tax=Trichoplax adhaerens TaxID=10228 RepID=B3RMU6_TRIAD|nr:hypothetical protein TRIADDRAFT_52932 [Trichoplax adhaerens]EDV27336.1 hypothetical protein TRIADDRAFT_52932 [Trichoplax adhaerens]RDD38130.1 Trace amine-associated receptor 7e [Trichoplax sp. H2]|eukprot:XP_002109170.1 hypothetical protein TRIADDRAFT_52932 [Trichoplax adhaerens]
MSNITNQTGNGSNLLSNGIAQSIIVYGVISGLTILTNISLLGLIISERKLHTTSNWIMASMFFTGIIFGLFYLLPRWTLYYQWLYKDPIACTVLPLTGIGLIINLNLHLTLVSLDRYLCVMFPIRYKIRKTCLIVMLSVVAVWLLSILSAYLPLVTILIPLPDRCAELTSSNPLHQAYLILIFSVLFFFPLLVLIVTYTQILFIVNNHQRNKIMHQRGSTPISLIKRNIRAIKCMAIMIGIFILFWLPYIVSLFMFFFPGLVTSTAQESVRNLQYLAFSYPAINPLVYAYVTASLRREIGNRLRATSTLLDNIIFS